MEEDEEIDILGTEISNLSSGEILRWEYTVHPQWHTEFWPENLPRQTSQDEIEMVQDEVVIEEPEPISDSFAWCEENSNDIILEEDIPYQSEVVTATAIEDETFEKKMPSFTSTKPTNPRSLLKVKYVPSGDERPVSKFKKTLVVNKSLLKSNYRHLSQKETEAETLFCTPQSSSSFAGNPRTKAPPKFIKTTKVKRDEVFQNKKMKKLSKELRNRLRPHKADRSSNKKPVSSTSGKNKSGKREKKFVNLNGKNITINHDAESGSSLDPRMNSTFLMPKNAPVQVIQNDSETDLEIDIESDAEVPLLSDFKTESEASGILVAQPTSYDSITAELSKDEKVIAKTRGYPSEIAEFVESLAIPTIEMRLSLSEVTEVEKYFHSEFFEGRPTKTPERYLKIRAFIINSWYECKPQYISKTAVRNGLKHCGDVNCISRIHCLLEQIGAINFGHNGQQFNYIRPLIKLAELFAQPRQSMRKSLDSLVHEKRQRMKSINLDNTDIDANFTVSHDDGRLIFHNNEPNSSDNEQPRRTRVTVKPELHLIECSRFGKDRFAPFKVSMTLSTLLCMQLHSLSSKYEVMGFLGGHRSKSVGRTKLSLTRYKPCQTSEQSGTMCEMCPVSQVQQSDNLIAEGYDLLGWFHSHPTFPPNPSVTDLGTQADMQLQFSLDDDRPFIGFILSCIDFKYKCIFILPEHLHVINATTVPYELDVDIIKDCSNLKHEIREVLDVIDRESERCAVIMEKFVKSASTLLQRFGYGNEILSFVNNMLF
ncbi:Histone H2A deubiquitinase MYSM1 [Pseudolycoriella hygida]|uniref:Histone H2A deubiquitinase MYSM1 n=1 Tax=Pseudolycoriella hygida TaxID=35572 RepID=A0A9Q0RSQ4_9DIPT|nr:Histone H2A deubiquitinase MYSM1 [Pseudolycoriella hygida]